MYYIIFYVLFVHDTDYVCAIIVRVRSGHEGHIGTIDLSVIKTLIITNSSCVMWFEGQHIDDYCVYFHILFFY